VFAACSPQVGTAGQSGGLNDHNLQLCLVRAVSRTNQISPVDIAGAEFARDERHDALAYS